MDDFDVLGKIGDGSFGQVYLCRRKDKNNETKVRQKNSQNTSNLADNQVVAIKKMNKKYLSWDECIKSREIIALKKLQHENLIKLEEVIRENDNLYLVFEHMEKNLYQLIRSR